MNIIDNELLTTNNNILIYYYFNSQSIHSKTEKPRPKVELTCPHCCRNFGTKHLLHQHIAAVHIGVRPYTCQICGYATAFTSSLKLHQRSHTGEKPFSCDECSFRTADHNTLRKHKLRHTGIKKYTCPMCDYNCIQASSYKNHLKSKHPGMLYTVTKSTYKNAVN